MGSGRTLGPRRRAGRSSSRDGDAKQAERSGGIAGVVAQRGSEVDLAANAQDPDGQVADGRHGPGRVAGADLGGVLGEGDVADVMQRLDAPVAADEVGQAAGLAWQWVRLVSPHTVMVRHLRSRSADPAGDAKRLGGMGEPQTGYGGDLEEADL